jgi:putative FmdB family regulatory protein
VPLYEYQCLKNHHSFEVRHGITEEPVHECPICGSDVRRVIHPVGIVFKGSGFYATDSRNSSSTVKSADGKASSEGKAEAKTESKVESPAATED